MSEKVVATIEKEALEKTNFYTLHRVHEKNNPSSLLKYVIVLNFKTIKTLGIENCITSNREIFSRCSELVDGLNLQKIKKEQEVPQTNELNVFINPFMCRLSEFARTHDINEEQSLEIMKQVVEALYCVYKNKYNCYNVRAENFVLVEQPPQSKVKKINLFRCKLQSLPFNSDIKYIASPYTWNEQYQPPEAYERKLKTEQLNQSLVWSIGCIWLHVLYGKHILDSLENIKKFCLGSGKFGVYNVEILGYRPKLSKGNQQLLQKMLNYFPKNRLTLNQVFEQKPFDQLINVLEQSASDVSDLNHHPLSEVKHNLKQSWDQQLIKYQQFQHFFLQLVQIISNQDFPILGDESSIIKKAVKDLNASEAKNLQMKKIHKKFSGQYEITGTLTLQRLKEYIRPYKFYYDKTIFLSNCSIHLMKTLREHCKQKKKKNLLDSPQLEPMKPIFDVEITYLFGILLMKLIYLQTLSQNLNLHQNVFNISENSHKKGQIYSIDNCSINNDHEQWIQFRSSGIYEALKYLVNSKLSQCDKQFQSMLERYTNPSLKKVSPNCSKMIINIYNTIDYKSCTVRRFLPSYQKILKDTLKVIDTYSVTNKQKYVDSMDHEQMEKEMAKIGYIVVALFIESETMFLPKNYKNLFGYYYQMQLKSITRDSLSSNNKKINNETRQKFEIYNQNEIFSFKTLELFFRLGDPKVVYDQVTNLLNRFVISFTD